jgi:hypothetical protein
VPPGGFVAAVVKVAVMWATQGHGEFVADLAAKGARLREAEVMCVTRYGAAQEAGLRRDEAEMLLVANAMRFGQGEGAFVDAGMSRLIYRGCWAGRAIQLGRFLGGVHGDN